MNKKNLLIWSFITIVLFISIIKWSKYLINNDYIEHFSNIASQIYGSTNHNVDIPLTTNISCENKCMPPNRCNLTGEQCFADVDCEGCIPKSDKIEKKVNQVRGQNDAGIQTTGETPTYSVLTTDIGTRAAFIGNKSENIKPAQYFQGVNTWRKSFDAAQELYDKRYTPNAQPFSPKYPERLSLSGQFADNGPLPANDFLGNLSSIH